MTEQTRDPELVEDEEQDNLENEHAYVNFDGEFDETLFELPEDFEYEGDDDE